MGTSILKSNYRREKRERDRKIKKGRDTNLLKSANSLIWATKFNYSVDKRINIFKKHLEDKQ